MKKLTVLLIAVCIVGCTTTKVKPVSQSITIDHVCIEDPTETSCFDPNVMDTLVNVLHQRGITTEIYTGAIPEYCGCHATIYCEITWDFVMYLHHAEIRLYKNRSPIGYMEYHLKEKGGLSLMKWGGAKGKVEPLINEMLDGVDKK